MSLDIIAVQVHDLCPCGDKVIGKLGLSVRRAVDLSKGTQLRVGAKNEIRAGGGPLDLAVRVLALEQLLVGAVDNGPGRVGAQQVDEEVVGELAGARSQDAGGGAVKVGREGAHATNENRQFGGAQGKEGSLVHKDLLSQRRSCAVAEVAETVSLGLDCRNIKVSKCDTTARVIGA